MDQLVETYKKKNNIKDDNFDNETYEPYNVLSLNNCVYVFKDMFKDKNNNYYLLKNKAYKLIKPKFINDIKYIVVEDVNKNKIKIII